MNGLRGVIFDCDGVLFESRGANLAFYNAVLAYFEEAPVLPEETERAHLCHTAASPRVIEALLGNGRAAAGLAYAASLDYRQFIPFMTPEPELQPSLAQLAKTLPLAVATNRGGSVREVLRHFALTDYFSVVVTSKDVPAPKPSPDMLLLALEQLKLAPTEVLFVGDSELDQAAARAAGIRFVAYKGMIEGDYTVHSHRELVALLAEAGVVRAS